MAYSVSIQGIEGMIRVTVDGGGNDFTRSYKPDDVAISRQEGSDIITLQDKSQSPFQTIVSFQIGDLVDNLGADTDEVYDNLEILIGRGANPTGTGEATESTLLAVKTATEAIVTNTANLGVIQDQTDEIENQLGDLKTNTDDLDDNTDEIEVNQAAQTAELQAIKTASQNSEALVAAIAANSEGQHVLYDSGNDIYVYAVLRDGGDNMDNTVEYFEVGGDPTVAVSPGPLIPMEAIANALLQAIATATGPGDGSNQSSINGYLKTLVDDSIPALNGAYDVQLVPVYDRTTGAEGYLRYRTKNGAVPFVLSPDAQVDLISSDGVVSGASIADVRRVGDPATPVAAQMTTQGGDSGYLNVSGTKAGSFNWRFTKNGGTSGIGKLYGNNEASQDPAYDVLIGATASLTADGAGVISWDVPYRAVKFVFDTQVGVGSTFDGAAYAV